MLNVWQRRKLQDAIAKLKKGPDHSESFKPQTPEEMAASWRIYVDSWVIGQLEHVLRDKL